MRRRGVPDGQIHDPQLVERGEREPLAVGRRTRAADLRDGERRVVDRIVELRERAELLLDVGGEGDLASRVPSATSTRRILPFHAAMSDFESGVNVMFGRMSREKRDSMSSRCTFCASQCSSPDSMSRMRSDVTESCARGVDEPLAVGLSTGLNAPPCAAARGVVSPVSRSYATIVQSKPVWL